MNTERPLPNARESELALLCVALSDPPKVLADASDVAPADFYTPLAGELWRIILALHKEGSAIDVATITARFPQENGDDLRGFLSEVVGSESGLPFAAADYAAAILETHRRRELIELAHRLTEGAFDKAVDVAFMEREVIRQLNASAPARQPVEIVSAAELVTKTFPDTDDIVAGIWPTKARLILSAPAKLGKTRFMLGLALAIATGKDALGFTITKPRRVLYVQAEVSERSLQERLKKMLTAFPCDEKLVRENLLFCNDARLKLTHDRHVGAICEAVELHRPQATVFDPLYKFNTGSEDKVQDMTAFFDPLDALIADYGVAVALVHHHGKGRGENLATTAHLNRGSSTIADWPDSLLTLQFEDAANDIVKLNIVLRNADEPEPSAYQRNRETLWFDPLPDYVFTTKGTSTTITNESVADTIGTGREVEYTHLARELAGKFEVCERTAKSAIKRAADAGVIVKNLSGRYEKAA